ncbi:MAG: hypothetical protein EOP09_05760 [Proteobacteria bacterium]|nr:MAG: hypothetical protein EOP09_05760 [Pseudomonadota bacterium]
MNQQTVNNPQSIHSSAPESELDLTGNDEVKVTTELSSNDKKTLKNLFQAFADESPELAKKKKLPSVFQYTNYREYLSEFFVAKKELSPAYSASAF